MFYTFYIQEITDSIARHYKSLGATSVESYVTWEKCERGSEGTWDWSEWDKKIKVLKDNNLKWGGFLEKSAQFRDYTDFDFLDETMLQTGALDSHKILVIIQGEFMELSDARCIADWVSKGGNAIVMGVPELERVEVTPEPEHKLFGDNGSNDRMSDKGRIMRVRDWKGLSETLRNTMSELKLPVCDLSNDSIFTTQIGKDQWFFLKTTAKPSIIKIILLDSTYNATTNTETITDVNLSRISK